MSQSSSKNPQGPGPLLRLLANDIGAKVSLITFSEVRYEGTLLRVDVVGTSITLFKVRIFGTEHRKVEKQETPPVSDLLKTVIFHVSCIKELFYLWKFSPLNTRPVLLPPEFQPHTRIKYQQFVQSAGGTAGVQMQQVRAPPPPRMPGATQQQQPRMPGIRPPPGFNIHPLYRHQASPFYRMRPTNGLSIRPPPRILPTIPLSKLLPRMQGNKENPMWLYHSLGREPQFILQQRLSDQLAMPQGEMQQLELQEWQGADPSFVPPRLPPPGGEQEEDWRANSTEYEPEEGLDYTSDPNRFPGRLRNPQPVGPPGGIWYGRNESHESPEAQSADGAGDRNEDVAYCAQAFQGITLDRPWIGAWNPNNSVPNIENIKLPTFNGAPDTAVSTNHVNPPLETQTSVEPSPTYANAVRNGLGPIGHSRPVIANLPPAVNSAASVTAAPANNPIDVPYVEPQNPVGGLQHGQNPNMAAQRGQNIWAPFVEEESNNLNNPRYEWRPVYLSRRSPYNWNGGRDAPAVYQSI